MNWNELIDRTKTHSVKWSYSDDEVIPLCIADMDFRAADCVIDALKQKAEHGIFGYTAFCQRYYDTVVHWWEKRHELSLKQEWIAFSPGIIPGINLLLQLLTERGDKVIVQSPVYYPFYTTIANNGCDVLTNALQFENGRYTIDFADLEAKAKEAKVLILCSPHNPVGRVWTKDELQRIDEICARHGVWIIADEIHADLVYEHGTHTPYYALGEAAQQRSIMCAAPSKTFNIAGLQTSIIWIANDELRARYEQLLMMYGLQRPNAFGIEATIASFLHGEQWLSDLLAYLRDNLAYTLDFFKRELPQIVPVVPEATHLIWLDCRNLNLAGEELHQFFLNTVKIKMDEGHKFGPGGDGFMRINIACPRERLDEVFKRMKKHIQ